MGIHPRSTARDQGGKGDEELVKQAIVISATVIVCCPYCGTSQNHERGSLFVVRDDDRVDRGFDNDYMDESVVTCHACGNKMFCPIVNDWNKLHDAVRRAASGLAKYIGVVSEEE